MPRFEATRIQHTERTEIARLLADEMLNNVHFAHNNGVEPITDYLKQTKAPLEVSSAQANTGQTSRPEFQYQDKSWKNFAELAEVLQARNVISSAAADALQWLEANTTGEGLNLSNRKVVVIGANAEMASTRLLLDSGANVLWLDMLAPDQALIDSPARAGQLTWAEPADLLQQPAEILATILDFAGSDPVDVCLYAYAPGQARELKLTVVMNAIVNAIPKDLLRTVTLLLSPTTATPLMSDDLAAMQTRLDDRPLWEGILGQAGLLGRGGGSAGDGTMAATRTVVAIQGASYQAAQYLGKLMMAESWAADSIRVSANTAAITKTRSMDHPVFDAAFDGASAMQVETFTAEQSQCLSGLLAVHDWLHSNEPIPGRVRIHGGLHTLPYPLNSALRIAAAIGFMKSPRLIAGLLRR